MKLVVGLGNPGGKYASTRHNVGFRVVDELARRHGIDVSRTGFSGLTGKGSIGGESVLLLKPGTFMNLSGRSVREAMTFYKLELPDLLVISDDMALPLGRLRLRKSGSAGGHNGLSSVIAELGDDGFGRLRIGIEQVSGARMVGHVLSPFTPQEEEVIGPAVARAADAVECWLADGMDTAMNRFNKSEDQAGR
ncbi:MAG TPA: aminoacyl-tRNA hydrolase [Phycisphaerae bacterium]|jgi:PTH1 family peptidyl-tRNA hydrolase|nr:aminoacyl-tRNA hydrolase [Phycisphaerae bacterium]HOB73625.1 aminoacyl-tRNA hydrolase [Phycisphaerae bacterium]HOJ54770.1 aminoacyl-tRNA hydrolase [Phycisphaerae bacterium]HOL25878.1 aminoacyl-tRNA hydrolase [Phycisphaerae bacterium]HPP21190.1 aminoacyl-tRNA hydrolase [Phycisphaerae bacterium]